MSGTSSGKTFQSCKSHWDVSLADLHTQHFLQKNTIFLGDDYSPGTNTRTAPTLLRDSVVTVILGQAVQFIPPPSHHASLPTLMTSAELPFKEC